MTICLGPVPSPVQGIIQLPDTYIHGTKNANARIHDVGAGVLDFTMGQKVFLAPHVSRVISFEEYDGREGIPTKRIRESLSRIYVFTLVDDRGQEIEIAFDLDDLDIVYFTMGDLEQLVQ